MSLNSHLHRETQHVASEVEKKKKNKNNNKLKVSTTKFHFTRKDVLKWLSMKNKTNTIEASSAYANEHLLQWESVGCVCVSPSSSLTVNCSTSGMPIMLWFNKKENRKMSF